MADMTLPTIVEGNGFGGAGGMGAGFIGGLVLGSKLTSMPLLWSMLGSLS